jgi:LDH2 family malate/lactate/ureidoglycolate dehydrogenase
VNALSPRYTAQDLVDFAARALSAAGLAEDRARVVASALVDADLFGHTTHGLALLSDYVDELKSGGMASEGEPQVLASLGAVECWDARRLPGIWTTDRAISAAMDKAETMGAGIIALRRSHHIACLASFLEAPARRGFIVLVMTSDPSAGIVAPYGATDPVITPNPIAAGIPSDPDPIILDISMSITAAGVVSRAKRMGERLPGEWLIGRDGRPTDDPAALENGGAILPIGGLDHGHKGFALGLLVECLTQGLSGYGRADIVTDWGGAVLVMAIKPEAFGPYSAFARQVDWLARACREATPIDKDRPVRLPGEAAFARRRRALAEGVELHSSIILKLDALALDLGIAPVRSTA